MYSLSVTCQAARESLLTKIYINIKLVFALLKGLHHPILIIVSVDFDTLIIIKNSFEPYELLIQ